MIKKYKFELWNGLFYLSFLFFFLIIQTSTWPFFISSQAIPQLWILPIVYLAVHKNLWQNIITIYLTALLFSTFTSMPGSRFLLILCFIYVLTWLCRPLDLKKKKVFILFCIGIVFFLPLIEVIVSSIITFQSTNSYSIWYWMLTVFFSAITMPLFSYIFFFVDARIQHLKSLQDSMS